MMLGQTMIGQKNVRAMMLGQKILGKKCPDNDARAKNSSMLEMGEYKNDILSKERAVKSEAWAKQNKMPTLHKNIKVFLKFISQLVNFYMLGLKQYII